MIAQRCSIMLNWYPNIITRFSVNTVSNKLFKPSLSILYLLPRFPLPRFPALMFGAENSTPAISTPALWCHDFHSRVFHSPEFSVPGYVNAFMTSFHYKIMQFDIIPLNIPVLWQFFRHHDRLNHRDWMGQQASEAEVWRPLQSHWTPSATNRLYRHLRLQVSAVVRRYVSWLVL